MTNAEHLIDNAIGCLETGEDFEYFIKNPYNKFMAETININLQYVWEMAQYVFCSLKPVWEDEYKE